MGKKVSPQQVGLFLSEPLLPHPAQASSPQIGMLYEALDPHRRAVNGSSPKGPGIRGFGHREAGQTLRPVEPPS